MASKPTTGKRKLGRTRADAPETAALQAGLDRLPIGFALFDSKRRLIAWNEALALICGYPKSFLKAGTPVEDFLRVNAQRGDYGPGRVAALVRKRVAMVSGRKPIVRDQRLADGRTLRISTRPVPPGYRLITWEDVTEARLAEQRYEVASRAVNEGIYDWDVATGKVYYSERVYTLLGFSAREFRTAAGWRRRIHPDDLPRFDAAIIEHFRDRTDRFQCDYRFRTRDGSWRWARQHGIALRDGSGRAVRIIGSTGDITELKHTEEALRLSEERHSLAMRAATEGVYEWDLETGKLYISDTTKVFFWSKTASLTPAVWNERVHPEDYESYRAALAAHFKRLTPHFEYEYRVDNGRGGYLWVLDRGIAVRNSAGRAIRLVGAVSDITERKRSEEQLRLAHQETTESLEQQKASGEVLAAISSSIADAQPVFEKIVKSCERLFAGRIVGLNLVGEDGLIHLGAYLGSGRAGLERIFPLPVNPDSGSGLAIVEARVVHYPDATAETVPPATRRGCSAVGIQSVIFAPVLWEGRGIGAIFVGRDHVSSFSEKEIALLRTFCDQAAIGIQNARLFREIREKSAQLEVANRHKSEFLANMSHELRTPLNAIIGFSEVLNERYFGELNEKQEEYVKDIHVSGRHLLSLINDILDLSKVEAGRMELDLSQFELKDAIESALTLVKERAQRNGIRLRFEVAAGLGEIRADERKVKQILVNLLSNAVKFTPSGGTVSVSARRNGTTAEIAVADTGPGIAAVDHAAVFEEFKQVGRDSARKAEGTGLGMPLSKRFAELHGGGIRLESAPGKGSTFTFYLPLSPAA